VNSKDNIQQLSTKTVVAPQPTAATPAVLYNPWFWNFFRNTASLQSARQKERTRL